MTMPETNRIEYKRELHTDVDIEKEAIAFLNYYEGGIIYIGIDKTGKALGVTDADGDALKIKDRIKNNISPSAMGLFDVVVEEREGKEIVKITVASGSEKPYFKKKYGMTEKGCIIRIGTAAEPMPQAMIDKLFSTRTRNSIGKIRSNRQDLTIKVAKYRGMNRVDLIENNEYGYCSLIKATKNVLDKIELENRTATQITSKERIDRRLWNPVAIREAMINSIVHNDFTREVPPKFEIFADRIEITSAGTLPEGLSEADFFDGVSIPRNRELMRAYRDLELVEQLGSGVPRILESYGRECFRFMGNFIRMTFPASEVVTPQVTEQVTEQVLNLLAVADQTGRTSAELMAMVGIKHRSTFLYTYLQPALDLALIEMTIPDKPTSSKQRYVLTDLGKQLKLHPKEKYTK